MCLEIIININMKQEENIQIAVCTYLKLQYPGIIFTCDLSSGMKLTIGQAVKAKKMRSSRGMPDLMILEPRGNHHGLFLELKNKGFKVLNKHDNWISEHIKEQSYILHTLREKKYCAAFSCGFDEAKTIIDDYLY